MSPSLVFVEARLTEASGSFDSNFDHCCDDKQIPVVHSSGKAGIVLGYRNTRPDSDRPYLALYPFESTSVLALLDNKHFLEGLSLDSIFGASNVNGQVSFTLRGYEKIQTFEGYKQEERKGSERGQTLVCVAMEPGESDEQEKDFEDWYRKHHLDVLSMCRNYRRTTRYKRYDGRIPRYLALHEYACSPSELPADQIEIATNTEWSQKIIREATSFQRDVFSLVSVLGNKEHKL